MVGVAGSLGWGDHHYGYMNRYLDMGIATITLHSFKSRGIQSTVGEQISVTIAMMVHDSYMLLNEIDNRANLDADNVAITGWSLGGGVSLFSAWKAMQQQLSPNLKFAAHLPFYPPCITNLDNLEFTDSPVHILIGELDNWVPAEPCVELIESLKDRGHNNAQITVFPDSHHSFDNNRELQVVDHAYSLTDCRLVLDEDGTVYTEDYHFPLSNSYLQKIGLYFCADRGTIFGGNEIAREKSKDFTRDFMTLHLLK